MKIIDCITYYSEDLMLDVRFNILNEYVEKFIVTESKFSHSGREKKLNFNINRFKEFKEKIIYIVSDDEPDGLLFEKTTHRKELPENYRFNAIKRISYQRNKLLDGIMMLKMKILFCIVITTKYQI